MRRSLRLLFTAALALGLLAPAAFAQSGPEPGVTVDPSSPSGKEYQLPVDKARQDAQVRQDAQGKEKKKSSSTPLFGSGVKSNGGSGASGTTQSDTNTNTTPSTTPTTPAPSQSAAPVATPKASSKSSSAKKKHRKAATKRRRNSERRSGDHPKTTAPAAAATSTQPPAKDVARVSADTNDSSLGGLGPALVVAVGGLGVLLLGGLTGLMLRRRTRPDS